MSVDIVVSSEDMSRLDMANSVVSKMMVVVPSYYREVNMTHHWGVNMTHHRGVNMTHHRGVRSSSRGSNKAGEEESSNELHGWSKSC